MEPLFQYLWKLIIPLKKTLIAVFTALAGFFLPIQPLVIVATTLSLFDWMIKLYCIYSVEGKAGIKSKKMEATFLKIIVYALFLSVLFVVDVFFIKTKCHDFFALIFAEETADALTKIQFASIGTFMILMREAKSVDENWEMAFGYSPIDSVRNIFGKFLKWK
jgi:hypothetical protein